MFNGMEIIKASVGMPVKDNLSRLMGESLSRPKIYGWHVDPSVSDPAQAVTYLTDAIGKTPAAMGSETFSYGSWKSAFFMPKPCIEGMTPSASSDFFRSLAEGLIGLKFASDLSKILFPKQDNENQKED